MLLVGHLLATLSESPGSESRARPFIIAPVDAASDDFCVESEHHCGLCLALDSLPLKPGLALGLGWGQRGRNLPMPGRICLCLEWPYFARGGCFCVHFDFEKILHHVLSILKMGFFGAR